MIMAMETAWSIVLSFLLYFPFLYIFSTSTMSIAETAAIINAVIIAGTILNLAMIWSIWNIISATLMFLSQNIFFLSGISILIFLILSIMFFIRSPFHIMYKLTVKPFNHFHNHLRGCPACEPFIFSYHIVYIFLFVLGHSVPEDFAALFHFFAP